MGGQTHVPGVPGHIARGHVKNLIVGRALAGHAAERQDQMYNQQANNDRRRRPAAPAVAGRQRVFVGCRSVSRLVQSLARWDAQTQVLPAPPAARSAPGAQGDPT